MFALLTEPDAIARWAPIPFEVMQLDGARLMAGSHVSATSCGPPPRGARWGRRSPSRAGGLLGRLLAEATEAPLAAGPLRISLDLTAHELQPALAA